MCFNLPLSHNFIPYGVINFILRYFKCNNYPLCHGRGVEDPNGFRVTIGHDCQEQPNAQRNKDFHNALKSKMSKHAKPFQVYQEVAKEYVHTICVPYNRKNPMFFLIIFLLNTKFLLNCPNKRVNLANESINYLSLLPFL